MSFLKKLFGGSQAPAQASPPKTMAHKGFTIAASPFKEGGQFQTSGIVSKTVNGVLKEHKFIRADRFPSLDEAVEFSLRKGCQIVDEQGERLFG